LCTGTAAIADIAILATTLTNTATTGTGKAVVTIRVGLTGADPAGGQTLFAAGDIGALVTIRTEKTVVAGLCTVFSFREGATFSATTISVGVAFFAESCGRSDRSGFALSALTAFTGATVLVGRTLPGRTNAFVWNTLIFTVDLLAGRTLWAATVGIARLKTTVTAGQRLTCATVSTGATRQGAVLTGSTELSGFDDDFGLAFSAGFVTGVTTATIGI
jgi:hypothetical protein